MTAINWADLKEKVREYAYTTGIDKIGFTDAGPLPEHLPRLIRRREAGYKHGLNEGEPEKRIDPRLHLSGAGSVISVAVAYPARETMPETEAKRGAKRGRISFISRGLDYHLVMEERLKKLQGFIQAAAPDARIIMMADRGEILEKALAVKAGLGWFGKHSLMVTPEYGSWVCLGELITDIPFPPDHPLDRDCGGCRLCIEACPTNALAEGEDLNQDRCLACVTMGRFLPQPEIRELMGDTLYGCDICQSVCPHNQKAGTVDRPEFECGIDGAFPVLKEILQMTNKDFRQRFGHTSGAWRGRTALQKNAVIAAGNLREREVVPELAGILFSDPRPVMRGAAAWALGRIGCPESLAALEGALEAERDPQVTAEIIYSQRGK